MSGKVAKSVEFPTAIAVALEEAAAASDRSLAAEVRIAVTKHLADVVIEAKTAPSGFSRDDAANLGVTFSVDRPGFVIAEWRHDGAVQTWGPRPLAKVLEAIESWHLYRVGMGAAERAPVSITQGSGTTAHGPKAAA
jgi:hypothetical protein